MGQPGGTAVEERVWRETSGGGLSVRRMEKYERMIGRVEDRMSVSGLVQKFWDSRNAYQRVNNHSLCSLLKRYKMNW